MIEGEMRVVRDRIQLDTKSSSQCNGKFNTNSPLPTILDQERGSNFEVRSKLAERLGSLALCSSDVCVSAGSAFSSRYSEARERLAPARHNLPRTRAGSI